MGEAMSPDVPHRGPGAQDERAMRLTGTWRIVEMDRRDIEAIDLVGPGFIEFGRDRTGHFGFIAVRMDGLP